MTIRPLICSKNGRQFLPSDGRTRHVCGKLFAKECLTQWTFPDGRFAVCEDDRKALENRETDRP